MTLNTAEGAKVHVKSLDSGSQVKEPLVPYDKYRHSVPLHEIIRIQTKSTMADILVKSSDSDCQGLIAAVVYGTMSTSMAFVNKLLMTTFGFTYQFFLMFVQMLLTVTVLELLRVTGRVTLPKYTIARGFTFFYPSMIYACHSVLALHALSGMNIPMYGVVKRCGPLVTLLLSIVILKKGRPSYLVVLSITLITSGCLIAGYGDLSFDIKAYTMGGISVFTQAFYLVILQKTAEGKMTAVETLHLNSVNTMPPLLFASYFVGELSPAVARFMHPSLSFLASFVLTISLGGVLNYLLFLCTTLNSAVTTSVVGALKSIAQTAIGMFTFGGISINTFTMSGISMNLFGGVLYTYTKYLQYQRRRATRKLADIEGDVADKGAYSNINGNALKS